MNRFLLAVLLAAPATAYAGAALDGLNALAGPRALVEAPKSAIPAARPAAAAPAADVTGDGWVEGDMTLRCPDMGWGRMEGSVLLSGKTRVSDQKGFSGDVYVSGSAFLDGRCRGGEAAATGAVTVTGKGVLRGPGGRTRAVKVRGTVPVDLSSSAERVHFGASVTVSGI